MKDNRRLVALGLAAALSTACDGHGASPDGRDVPHLTAAMEETAPTLQDAATATYWRGQSREITLANGQFRGTSGERVELLRQFYRTGDLDADGAEDAVVVLSATDAGAASGFYVAVLRHLGTATITLGAERLASAGEVQGLDLDGRRIVVDITRPGPGGQSEPARVTYEVRAGALVKVSEQAR